MRRKDRETDRQSAEKIIDKAAFATLATTNTDGSPYCIPLSPVREGGLLYFHCALEGKKLDNMRADSRVCVSFVGETHVPENAFTIHFESAVVFGRAEEVVESKEKVHALRLLCEHYTPDNMDAFDATIAIALDKTGIWKITIDDISGKIKAPREHT